MGVKEQASIPSALQEKLSPALARSVYLWRCGPNCRFRSDHGQSWSNPRKV